MYLLAKCTCHYLERKERVSMQSQMLWLIFGCVVWLLVAVFLIWYSTRKDVDKTYKRNVLVVLLFLTLAFVLIGRADQFPGGPFSDATWKIVAGR